MWAKSLMAEEIFARDIEPREAEMKHALDNRKKEEKTYKTTRRS